MISTEVSIGISPCQSLKDNIINFAESKAWKLKREKEHGGVSLIVRGFGNLCKGYYDRSIFINFYKRING